jgi:hypothetical protein
MFCGRVGSSCSTTVVLLLLKIRRYVRKQEVRTVTNGTYPWTSVPQIFRNKYNHVMITPVTIECS